MNINAASVKKILFNRRIIIACLLLLITFFSIAGLYAYSLVKHAPVWWRTINPDDEKTIRLGSDVERGFTAAISHDRPAGEIWAFRITSSQANAWLNTRLPLWLANRDQPLYLPDSLREMQVQFDRGKAYIGVVVTAGRHDRIFTASVRPEIRDGRLLLTASTFSAGQLGMPASVFLDLIRKSLPRDMRNSPSADHAFAVLRGKETLEPVFRLDDGRQLRVLKTELKDGELVVTCRTETP